MNRTVLKRDIKTGELIIIYLDMLHPPLLSRASEEESVTSMTEGSLLWDWSVRISESRLAFG